jgi:hypothetical protein
MTQLHPEISDVDISPIFHWFGEQEITDTQGKTFRVFVRLVGDAELNRARVFALRKSSDLRKRFKDPNSDERNGFIQDLDMLNEDQLKVELIHYRLQELYLEAGKEVKIAYPKEPSGDDLERQERYQEEVDAWQLKLTEAINNYVEPRYAKIKEKYNEKPINELYEEYQKIIVSKLCEAEFQTKFKEICVFFGTHSDEKMTKKFFNSFEEFENLRTIVKQQFIEFYDALEMSTEELKK